jgi:hypothetical protein
VVARPIQSFERWRDMKNTTRTLRRTLCLSLLICSGTNFVLGQGSKQNGPEEQIEDRDRDNPTARDQWFMRGRTVPTEESAAALRYRAYQQKLQLRRQQFSARVAAPAPHVGATSVWNPLGPAPLASDATGTNGQNYREVSGRATAVAIDPADPTGNTVYVGGAHGGVWKSTNAGPLSATPSSVVWTPVLDYEATLAVGAIAIQPGNANPSQSLILVGTGEPNSSADSYYGLGILRSADGGQTWSLTSTANGGSRPFAGMGFSKIAFNNTTGKTNVVVAAAAAAETGITLGLDTTGTNRGLYYSQDSGVTWNYATVQDAGVTVDAGSATSVVYNQGAGAFFAALRYHGIYSSTDGITWTRLSNQPAGLTTALCPSTHSTACPIYRAELAVVPGRNEIYTWVVALDTTGNELDGGIWASNNGGSSWTQISDTGITNCGDGTNNGCGVNQGSYDLELGAVPNGTATDLYAGAINLYKCTVANPSAPTCSFLNLTHVYACSPASAPAHVHPDQHALDALVVGSPAKAVMYFANDGGIYRALDGYSGLSSGLCTGHNLFDSLNLTLGSMTQFVSFSLHPTDPNTLLGGTQDNGSPATASASTSSSWINVLSGDGGYNAISPANGTDWFTANPDTGSNTLAVNYCGGGINCKNSSFQLVVMSSQLGSDDGSFYFPYMLDSQAPTQLIIGTCRVWRGGPATSGAGTYTALSNNFDTGNATSCSGGEVNLVRSLASGGPKDPVTGNSKVIYAGTEGLGGSTTPAGGRVFVTTNAGTALMADVTGTINPGEYPVSGIALDPSDATGKTAFVTIMGFHVGHVFKTTNAGQTWTNYTASLPDAPADAVVVDSQAGVVYVGTDVGVFASSTASASWAEVGPLAAVSASGYLPNVPVTALRLFSSGGQKLLRASTYGRGIWEYNLSATPDYQITVSNSPLTVFPSQTAAFNGVLTALSGYSSQVTLSCAGATVPGTCTPNPAKPVPASPPGTSFTVSSAGVVGDYPFNIHAVGSDASSTTHDAAVTLHVVDFALSAPNPASVSVQPGATSSPVTFQVTGLGSFNGTVTLACSGLPAGASCTFSPSASVSALPASITLTIPTTAGTSTGTFAVTISANTPGAPVAKTQALSLTVTAPKPDYILTISNSPVSATVNQSGTFNGLLKAVNGYASAVSLSCGAGAPATCTISPSLVTPTVAGAAFTVTAQSSSAQVYSFNINGAGTDASHVAHSAAAVFNSLFTFTILDNTSTQSVMAGQSATYSLTVTPVGSTTFPNAVSFSCSGLPAGATCSNPQISLAASGAQTIGLTISTLGPNSAVIKPVAQKHNRAPFLLWVSAVGIVIGGFARRPSSRRRAMLSLVLTCALILPSCGGGSSSGGGGGGGGIAVNVSPKTASRFPTQQQQFTPTVTGTTNTAVTWQVSGITGGSATVGTINNTGLYTAPAVVPSPASVVVSAISQADITKSGSATVSIQTPTPSGTYTVTITATAGSVTHTASATLTVQ